jgi:ABC-type glycerol-3-phosphate transport system permease component
MQESNNDFFEDTHALLTNYVDDRLLLLKIKAAEKSGKLVSAVITFLIVAFFIFFILLFISIMGGYYFAEVTGSTFLGFSIIAGIYFVLFLLFLAMRKQLVSKRINNHVIKIFFEKSANEMELNSQDDE